MAMTPLGEIHVPPSEGPAFARAETGPEGKPEGDSPREARDGEDLLRLLQGRNEDGLPPLLGELRHRGEGGEPLGLDHGPENGANHDGHVPPSRCGDAFLHQLGVELEQVVVAEPARTR